MYFAILTDQRVRLKESKKIALARRLKKLYDMKVTMIPIVISVLISIPKVLVKELGDLEIRG